MRHPTFFRKSGKGYRLRITWTAYPFCFSNRCCGSYSLASSAGTCCSAHCAHFGSCVHGTIFLHKRFSAEVGNQNEQQIGFYPDWSYDYAVCKTHLYRAQRFRSHPPCQAGGQCLQTFRVRTGGSACCTWHSVQCSSHPESQERCHRRRAFA